MSNNTQNFNIKELKMDIDYDKLAEAIVKAQKKSLEENISTQKEKREQYRYNIGYRDYSKVKNKIKRFFLTLINRIKVFFKVFFAKKDTVRDMDVSRMFVQSVICHLVGIAQTVLYIASIMFIVFLFYHPGMQTFGFQEGCLTMVLSLVCFMFAQIFRLIKIQVDNLKDRDYLFVIFGAICAAIPGIVPIISFIINIGGKT